ncbi:hypothetical protein POTOM_005007 [Populus tomentosa]|uniref:Uncharacterized protein n=1 Tax=Populus tomentosa TaxID=118781 RepID=A0A8X8DFN8_POPTO|nr:hypothetical protein POTOM_005007 [Populus tomentosa]
MEALYVFKVFVAYQNKPSDIVSIGNRSTLLRFLAGFKTDKQDEQFETNKAQVMKEIVALEPRDQSYDMREIVYDLSPLLLSWLHAIMHMVNGSGHSSILCCPWQLMYWNRNGLHGKLTVGSLDCGRRGVASDIDEPYNLHLAYRVFYWLLTFYPKLQKSSVNLEPTLDIDNLKDPEQFFFAFERLEDANFGAS